MDTDARLEALELKLMDMELGQQALDAVVIAQSAEIDALRTALDRLRSRLEASSRDETTAGSDAMTGSGGAGGLPGADEVPPHY